MWTHVGFWSVSLDARLAIFEILRYFKRVIVQNSTFSAIDLRKDAKLVPEVSLKDRINSDLKSAMLAQDKRLVSILRSLKSAILYKEVADGKREEGLSDEETTAVFKKEKKSRQDALALYDSAGEQERADEERYQIEVIEAYLPEEMSEDDIEALVQKIMSEQNITDPTPKDMGRIISAVKAQAPNADGALVANVVKSAINGEG